MPPFVIILAMFLTLSATPKSFACGEESNCSIMVDGQERHYRIRLPDGHDNKTSIGAIIFMHGYRGSANGVMRNKALGAAVSEKGLALIATKSFGPDWVIPNAPNAKAMHREEIELKYFDSLLNEVSTRFSIDMTKIMAAGFSAGGMMTWTLACHRSEKFAAFAPIAGTFWDPIPENCDSAPANVFHTHGTSDKVVPITGRPIADTKQGDVLEVLKMYADDGKYEMREDYEVDDLKCQRQVNPDKKVLDLCLHPQGHTFKSAFILRAWDEMMKLNGQRLEN